MLSVRRDDARQKIEEQLPFGRRKRGQNPSLCSKIPLTGLHKHSLAFTGQVQQACAPIFAIDLAEEQTFGRQTVDKYAHAVSVDAKPGPQTVLIDARLAILPAEASQRAIFDWRQIDLSDRLGLHGG